MRTQDKTQHGTRVRYMNNSGDLTQFGTVIGLVTPESYRHVHCDCGIDRNDARHPDVWVKWDNGTKSHTSTCHLVVIYDRGPIPTRDVAGEWDRQDEEGIDRMIDEGGPV